MLTKTVFEPTFDPTDPNVNDRLRLMSERAPLLILGTNDEPTFTELTIDRTRYRTRREPEPATSWSGAVTRLHQRIANAKRIEDGPELFDALRGEP